MKIQKETKEKPMKEGLLIETVNALKIKNAIKYLETRPLSEMVGLGLVYGQPGLGKSRVTKQMAIQEGYIYIRLDATSTARSFLTKLYKRVMYKRSEQIEYVKGSSAFIMQSVIDMLSKTPYSIVVDEIDYAFRKRDLLGTIRDIVDHTFSIVLIVGMADAKDELLRANAHYFDRCNAFVHLQPLTKKDVGLYLSSVSDVKMDQKLVDHIFEKTLGNVRQIVKQLRKIEALAKKHKTSSIDYLFFNIHMKEVA
jgi:Cdc6-like AAA superfamily ATPase